MAKLFANDSLLSLLTVNRTLKTMPSIARKHGCISIHGLLYSRQSAAQKYAQLFLVAYGLYLIHLQSSSTRLVQGRAEDHIYWKSIANSR
jgi:hypothetical protein